MAAKLLSEWPVARPGNWLALLNRPLAEAQVEQIRTCIARDRPLGSAAWVKRISARMRLEFTLRRRGRPRKKDLPS